MGVTMIIHIGMQPTTEPKDNSFLDIKQSEDFHTWQGNACTLPLPGGGNTLTRSGDNGDGKKK
jgi:hypothetical protein